MNPFHFKWRMCDKFLEKTTVTSKCIVSVNVMLVLVSWAGRVDMTPVGLKAPVELE
jgi:hypothetical protein